MIAVLCRVCGRICAVVTYEAPERTEHVQAARSRRGERWRRLEHRHHLGDHGLGAIPREGDLGSAAHTAVGVVA